MARLPKFLSRIFGGYRAQNPAPWDDWWYQDPHSGFIYPGPSTAGVYVSASTAMRLTAVYACVRVLSEDIASLPLIIYRRRADGGKDRDLNHPLYDILHDRPNQWQTSFEFREMMQGHLELRGNAYARIVPGPRGFADQLWPLHPDLVTPQWSDKWKDRIIYEYREPGSPTELIQQENMFHIRLQSSDGLKGLSPIDLQREAIGLGLATQTYASKLFAQGAHPGGLLTTDAVLSQEAFDRVNKDIIEKRSGLHSAHRPWVLHGGLKWQQLGLTNEQAQFIESRKFTRSEIAGMFRVSAHKINDHEKSTFSNIESLEIQHVTNAIRPRCVRWEQAIKRDLIQVPRIYFAEFLLDGLLRGDAVARATALQIQRRNGVINADEWRAMENMNPLPNGQGQRYIVESNMQFLSAVGTLPVSPRSQERLEAMIKSATERLARKEISAVLRLADKYRGSEFEGYLNEFYGGFCGELASALQIPHEAAEAVTFRAKRQIIDASNNGGVKAFMIGSEVSRSAYLANLALGTDICDTKES